MRTITILPLAFIFLASFTLYSCGSRTASSEKKDAKVGSEALKSEAPEILPDSIVELNEAQIKAVGISFGKIENRPLGKIIRASGIVSVPPGNMASVCTPMGGSVKNTVLLPGSFVKKGQVLASIENTEFIDLQQNYLEAASKLEFAEAEYNRHKQLHSDDVYSTQNLQQVTADYRSLKTQVSALSQKLLQIGIDPAHLTDESITRSIEIAAPIDGYIRVINVTNGKFVSPSEVLFEIVNNDRMYLELTLFEKEMNQVAAGQQVEFFLNNESEAHHAVIYQVAKAVSADKSFRIYANVALPCKNVIPGMYVSANIASAGTRVTSVPSEALVRFNEKSYIFIFERDKLENGKPVTEYRMVEVTRGITSGNYTGISLPVGFDYNARVVVKGAFQLMAAKKNAGQMSC